MLRYYYYIVSIDNSQVLFGELPKKSLGLLYLKINKQKYNQMGGGNFLDKKEQILDLYFDKHLKQIQISKMVNASQQYISKIRDMKMRKVLENLAMQKSAKLLKLNIRKIMLEEKRKILFMNNY